MSLNSRLKQIEKKTSKEPPVQWLIYERKPGIPEEEQQQAAIAEFKAKHPIGWATSSGLSLSATTGSRGELTCRIALRGDLNG